MPDIKWTETEEGISSFSAVFLFLLGLVLVLTKYLRDRPMLASICPEAGMTILVGIVAGAVINLAFINSQGRVPTVAEGLLQFSPEVFIVVLLPPIIFNSGYHLRDELFFFHLEPIALFACVGTVVSALSIALILECAKKAGLLGNFYPQFSELLTFGGLISATDPVSTLAVFSEKRVDPQLFYLVFGESVLNDAVGLVLFSNFAEFVAPGKNMAIVPTIVSFLVDFFVDFVGSLVLGVVSGMATALLLKTVDMRRYPILELSLYILTVYIPYFLSEILQLSGIVTILFTGISVNRYASPNLSGTTQASADVLFRLAAYLAETLIFLNLGMSVFGIAIEGHFRWRMILWSLLACTVGRFLNIYPITYLFNLTLKDPDGSQLTKPKEMDPLCSNGSYQRGQNGNGEVKTKNGERHDQYIGDTTAHMMMFSGLRGAVAYSCAKSFPEAFGHAEDFVVVTTGIVLVTVFVLGGTTDMVLQALGIKTNVDEDAYMREEEAFLNVESIHHLENQFINPVLIRDYQVVDDNKTVEIDSEQPSSSNKHNGQPSNMPLSERLPPRSDESNGGQVTETDNLFIYHSVRRNRLRATVSHISITQSEHVNIVGLQTQWRRSIYDFGQPGRSEVE